MNVRNPAFAVASAAASGLLCGLAFPPASLSGLAWFGLAPFLVALRLVSARVAPLAALAFSLGLWAVVWYWGPGAVSGYFGQPLWVGWAFFSFLALCTVLPAVALFAVAYQRLARSFRASLPLLAAAAWAGSELLRARLYESLSFGNPWAVLGYSQVDFTTLVQVSAITGVFGVSFVIVAVNASVADWAFAALEPGRKADAWKGSGVTAACVGVVAAFGLSTLRAAEPPAGAQVTRVGVVQPDLDPASRWRESHYGRHFSLYLNLSEALARRERIDLLVWPESAMTFFLEQEEEYRRSLASYLSALDLELVAGAPRAGDDAFWNSVYRVEPDGAIAGRYDKRVLLPLAEFAPFGRVDLLRRGFGDVRAYRPGDARPPLATRAGAAGILVCNEAMYGEVARARVREGATLLIHLAHDGWIPAPAYAEMQLQLSRFRAVETRRALIRSSSSGPSAVVDPWGRVEVRTEPFTEATLAAPIVARTDTTLYTRFGDAFAIGCALVAAALAAVTRATPRAPARSGAP